MLQRSQTYAQGRTGRSGHQAFPQEAGRVGASFVMKGRICSVAAVSAPSNKSNSASHLRAPCPFRDWSDKIARAALGSQSGPAYRLLK